MNKEILLSNILMEGIKHLNPKLKEMCFNNGYGTWEQYILNPSNYGLENYKCIIIIIDGETLMDVHNDCGRVIELLTKIESFAIQNKGVRLYISNISCRLRSVLNIREMIAIEAYENTVNQTIYEICERNSNVFCFNLKKMIMQMGEGKAYSKKFEYLSSCPYSIEMMKVLADELVTIDYFKGYQRKKCLILDLDNTLWGGVIGEDGKEGILIGRSKEGKQYYDFQKVIKKILASGTVLALASKNNETDVDGILTELNMPLREKDFVAKRINWQPKSKSIREICNELNIGMDSVVFVDDSPVEREEVKTQLTMVEVPDFPSDPSYLEDFALVLYKKYFSTDKILLEDEHKTDMYLANAKRSVLKANSIDINSFLKELDIKLNIEMAKESQIQRIAQMTQKTNQFNMTTRRYSEQEISDMLTDFSTQIYVCSVTDKFGDNGIASICILKISDNDVYIDEFLMSCRVMERKIEYDFLRFIENSLYDIGQTDLYGDYIQTNKNIPASDFYPSYGFNEIDNSEEKTMYHKKIEHKKYSGLMEIMSK